MDEQYVVHVSGFGGLEVACWPLVPRFTPVRSKKSSACLPSEGK